MNNYQMFRCVLIYILILLVNTFSSATEFPVQSGYNVCQIDSSAKDTLKIKHLFQFLKNDTLKEDTALLACLYHQVALNYHTKKKYIAALSYYKESKKLRVTFEDSMLWKTNRNIGLCYFELSEFKTSNSLLIEASLSSGAEKSGGLASIFRHISIGYLNQGESEKAMDYAYQALSINASPIEILKAYNNLSIIFINFLESGDSTKVDIAIEHTKKALKLSKKLVADKKSNYISLVSSFINLALVYKTLEKYDQAIRLFNEALNHLPDKDYSYKALILNNIASVWFDKGNYEKAITTLLESLNLRLEHNKHIAFHYTYAASYENLAENYNALQHFETALLHYQKALSNRTKNFRNENIFKNPNPANDELFVYSNPHIIRVLHLKATSAYQYYQQNNNQKYLTLANQTYQTAFDFHDKLQKDISTENSRLFQAKNIVPYIENALKVAYQQQKNGQEVSEVAFRFMEKNKATVLLQSMNEANALQYANLPDSLLEQEKDLKIALTFHTKQLNEAVEYKDSAETERLNDILFDERQQYNQLINNLENNYPDYYRLKYQQNQIQLIDVQNTLDDKTALLEYFVGDSAIYILSIQKNHSRLYEVEKPADWKTTFDNFRQSITNVNQDKPALYVENAHCLYQLLLSTPIFDLPETVTQLQIIPDAELNYVPFEILLTEGVHTDYVEYKKLPYLLNNKSVGYAYSAALLLENQKIAPSPKMFAYGGYAPAYSGDKANDLSIISKLLKYIENILTGKTYSNAPENTDDDFHDLPVARQTVQNLAQTLNGKAYVNQQANLSNFLNDSAGYNILHLSMHGVLNDQNPLNSYLAFTKKGNFKLHAYDLYNKILDADLTILHACNTGTGELQKGEGVMSLSRAFTYAGCPSLVMSLWQIPEEATSEITKSFVTNLQTGLSKDVALQKAKLAYLQNENTPEREASPAYWAGLVATGNLNSIKF